MVTNALKAILIIAASNGVAFASNTPLVFRLAYAITALVLVCFFWSWRNIAALEIQRQPMELRTQVGETVREAFQLKNRSLLPNLCAEIYDHSSLPHHKASLALPLSPNSTKQWEVSTICQKRGKFKLGPYSIVTTDPLGIFRWRKFFDRTWTVLVYPPTYDLPHFHLSTGELAGGQSSRRRTYFTTPRASGIREYVPSDSLNRIHWPSTAKMLRLMSKEFELDPAADVWIMLDLQREVQAGSGLESTVEYGVAAAASLAKHLLDKHWTVGLIASTAHRTVVHSDRGAQQLLRMLEELSVVRAEGELPLAEVLISESRRFGRNTTLIVISPSREESWISALKDLAARGVEAIAVVVEGRSFGHAPSSAAFIDSLVATDIPKFVLKRGDNIGEVLRL